MGGLGAPKRGPRGLEAKKNEKRKKKQKQKKIKRKKKIKKKEQTVPKAFPSAQLVSFKWNGMLIW